MRRGLSVRFLHIPHQCKSSLIGVTLVLILLPNAVLLSRTAIKPSALRYTTRSSSAPFWNGQQDHHLGQRDDFLFQQTARLEVSGIGAGNEQEVKQRTRQKIMQTSVSDNTNLPAVVVVVEFSAPMAEVTYRNAV